DPDGPDREVGRRPRPLDRGPRPARPRLPAPEARPASGRRPPLLSGPVRPRGRRRARRPGRDGQVPDPLRGGNPPGRPRGGRAADRRVIGRILTMTTERPVDDRIRSWLLETAPAELPDRVFDAT